MAAKFSNTWLNTMLDSVLGSGGNKDIRLFTADTALTSPTNESADANYELLIVTNNTANFPNASGGIKRNGAIFLFGFEASADFDVNFIGISDAGNPDLDCLLPLPVTVTILAGKKPRVAINDLEITLEAVE